MATQKPISTISYNTEDFLKEHLDTWVSQHIIQAYQYICHKGEDGDKDHIHLRVEPNKKLDPMDLTDLLKEFEKGKDKPLTVRTWRPSKEEDWFLYAVHDKEYLELKYGGGDKGEKLPYEYTDIQVSEGYDLDIAFTRAKASMKHTSANLITRMRRGESPANLITSGENVFTVNALMRSLNLTEYERQENQIKELSIQIEMLHRAISVKGFIVVDEGGCYRLEKALKGKTVKEDGTGKVFNENDEPKPKRNVKKARKKQVGRTDEDQWMPIPEDNPLTDE